MKVSLTPNFKTKKATCADQLFRCELSQLHWASLSVPAMGKFWRHTQHTTTLGRPKQSIA